MGRPPRKTPELERVDTALNWLIYRGIAASHAEIAAKIGYKPSSISQIVNGSVKLSVKFIRNICALDESLNAEWIKTGVGEMLLSKPDSVTQGGTSNVNIQGNGNKNSINATLQAGHWRKIAEQNQALLLNTQEQLLIAQKQISALLSILSAQSKLQDNVAEDISSALDAVADPKRDDK